MQHIKNINEVLIQNKTLERRNDELLRLLEAWQTKNQKNKPSLVKSLNMHEIENLIIRYYQVYKVPVSLYDETGKLLFSIGWKNVCLRFHKNVHNSLSNCAHSVKNIPNKMADIISYSFKCNNNINSIAILVGVQKENLGTLVVNQFIYDDEVPTDAQLQQTAYQNGFNYEDYKKAFNELPVYSESEVEKITEHYILFSEMISFIASHNIQITNQQELNSQKKEICNIFKEKLEEQSYIIRTVHQYLMQQSQEIEMLKSELHNLNRKIKMENKEKSLVEVQPG
jgi:hypothetical protein